MHAEAEAGDERKDATTPNGIVVMLKDPYLELITVVFRQVSYQRRRRQSVGGLGRDLRKWDTGHWSSCTLNRCC